MKSRPNLENLIDREMRRYAAELSERHGQEIVVKSKNYRWLPQTHPLRVMVKTTYTFTGRNMPFLITDERIVKQFLPLAEGNTRSGNRLNNVDLAKNESELMHIYSAGDSVPKAYGELRRNAMNGVVMMEYLGPKSIREQALESGGEKNLDESMKLLDEGLSVLDRFHDVGMNNIDRISEVTKRSMPISLRTKLKRYFARISGNDFKDYLSASGFLDSLFFLKYLEDAGGYVPVHGDMNSGHIINGKVIDLGKIGPGDLECDRAGLVFDMPLPVEEGIKVYKDHYNILENDHRVMRLLCFGLVKTIANYSYLSNLRAANPTEHSAFLENYPRYANPSLYKDITDDILDSLAKRVGGREVAQVTKLRASLAQLMLNSAIGPARVQAS